MPVLDAAIPITHTADQLMDADSGSGKTSGKRMRSRVRPMLS